ncbi:MAG: hypothetical protein MR902_07545 [Campylobacter sp.]|nr:hypothetical protein [Campylobacter sp.]
MYVSGKCNGMFELLEVIKTTALEVGWEVLGEKALMFDKIYNSSSFINSNPNLCDESLNTKGTLNFINLPRKSAINGVVIKNLEDGGVVSLYGVLEDNSEELLKDGLIASTDFNETKKYNRYKVISTKNASEINLKFANNTPLEKEIYLQSDGSSGMEQICVNFKVLILPNDHANLICQIASSYSRELSFYDQSNALNSTLAGYDKEIEYFINCDKNRIIVALKIYDPNDVYLKDALYQIGYFGKLRIYGGEWSFTTNLASIGGSYDLYTRFSNINKCCLENPKLLINAKVIDPSSNISGWSLDSLDISPYPNGELYSVPIIYFKKNTQNITSQGIEPHFNGEIYGELDGLVKIVATGGIRSEDEIVIDDKTYIVIQDGINKDAYNMFAIRKD